jgi:hypothetical protein
MRSGTDQSSRGRFNSNRPSHQQSRAPQGHQTLDSHGPGERVRGTASQISERYLTLAREASRSDDRVTAECYYQHAEHYFRINHGSSDRYPHETLNHNDPAPVGTGIATAERNEVATHDSPSSLPPAE